jgi:uncharacterized membrane protein YphA (DoxX/SURF4 family)
MVNMDHSMAQGDDASISPVELAAWKKAAGWICAGLLALIFLVAGVWKLSDPVATAARMVQALVPRELALACALATGIAEATGGGLVLVPRWRRWGALLCGVMLIVFMVYVGVFYNRLLGEDCSCFPFIKRAVRPGFFFGDLGMLLLAVGAWVWARRPEGLKNALVAMVSILVFAGVLYGVSTVRQTGVAAPATIQVDGKPYSLQGGRVLLYFFDPQCSHCDAAARVMARHKWKDVRIVAVATATPQFARQFLDETKLRAVLSLEAEKLKAVFPFGDPPYGVALENGHQVKVFPFFDGDEPANGLRSIGFIE